MLPESVPTDPRLERAKRSIRTPEEYVQHPFAKGDGEASFIVDIAHGEKRIVYFGSTHTNHPDHPVFDEIAKAFDEAQPEIVYVEGMEQINDNVEQVRKRVATMSLEEAKKRGESYFTLKLAVDAGIPFESPEPHHRSEIEHLLHKQFPKNEIFLFYMYRVIAQYQRTHDTKSKEGCMEYLKPYIDFFTKESAWPPEEIASLVTDLQQKLDVNDESYGELVDPMPWEGRPRSMTNEIAAASGHFRDEYALERLEAGLKSHNRLFAVYGSGHAVRLELSLRVLLVKE